MSHVAFSIKATAQRIGLSPHVIRVWERRYGAVTPTRTDTNRRTYTEEEVNRLALLKSATEAGHSIGQIANLTDAQLQELARDTTASKADVEPAGPTPASFVAAAIKAIQRLNGAALDGILSEAAGEFGTQGLLQKVIVPLTYRIGDLWHKGDVTAAQEHFASSLIRSFLGNHARPYVMDSNAPLIVVGTPLGQFHELGAVIVASAASSLGWRVANLSASLPTADIAAAARRGNARAVALSIVFPEDDPNLPGELESLRRILPPAIAIIVGGRAAPAYSATLAKIEAGICHDLEDFYRALGELRTTGSRN